LTLGAAALFGYRVSQSGQWQPLTAHLDGLLLISALFAGAVWYIHLRPRLAGLSAFALPVLGLLLAWGVCASQWTYRPFHLDTLHPVWNGAHLAGVYLGTLFASLAAMAGGMFLFVQRRLKQKLPLSGLGRLASLETLETLIIRSATLGFVLLTLGLVTGVVILSEGGEIAGGGWWAGAKIALATLAWLVFALVMNVRFASSFRGARAAWLAIGGLVLLLATYGVVTALPATAPGPAAASSGVQAPARADMLTLCTDRD
ncbi:MAG: cytochrome c biogenesis protein CcsA, partial [Phycisphaeraceae bacterium]